MKLLDSHSEHFDMIPCKFNRSIMNNWQSRMVTLVKVSWGNTQCNFVEKLKVNQDEIGWKTFIESFFIHIQMKCNQYVPFQCIAPSVHFTFKLKLSHVTSRNWVSKQTVDTTAIYYWSAALRRYLDDVGHLFKFLTRRSTANCGFLPFCRLCSCIIKTSNKTPSD